ncbi:periplasmic heavy metal sensor [Alkalicaulis satelles]|uniref:Periplasmic heavy metal sensor n=1 Tax=Alkalicaulis satelles TaxID=2609175 RepID=A0A5M6ZK10_9PROT|nr:periplasmic heavy metal sensor [Alkalicaulis satelles]KAA5805156.1 periplasmic heavy metal sensor [Alkalicaulis satelles]
MNRVNIWIVLLLVSVLLNGVLIGAGARHWFAPEPSPAAERPSSGPVMMRGNFSLRAFMRALPEDQRPLARERFEAASPHLRELGREAMQARRTASETLRAQPFDAEAAQAAMAGARDARARMDARTEAVILDILERMEPEAREAVLEAAFAPPERGARLRRSRN